MWVNIGSGIGLVPYCTQAIAWTNVDISPKVFYNLIGIPRAAVICFPTYTTVKPHISHTLVGNKIVDNSDVVGASPVGAAPTTSSFSTSHLDSMDWTKTTARRD